MRGKEKGMKNIRQDKIRKREEMRREACHRRGVES